MIEYANELGDVLRTFDTDKLIKFIEENKEHYRPQMYQIFLMNKDNKQFLLGCMAKMIMNRTDMDAGTRKRAKAILKELNWDTKIF